MDCPYCGEEIPEYSNLDFHVQTEHGFSVPAQYTQDTITRSMKDPDIDKIESYEYTQKQLEDAKNWWEKAKLPHETHKWKEMRIGDRQRIIGRYADYMYNKYVVGKEGQRDLKPTPKNHGTDFYMDLALDDYLNNTTHTPDEYENKLYGLEDTALKRYGVPRDLPNGEEIVDSTYGTELHAKDWWDSKNIENEKGDGKSRKWEDLHPDERKGIRDIFDDKVRGDYLQESFEQLAMLDTMPIASIVTMMAQKILPDLEFLPNKIQQRVKSFAGTEAVGLSRDWDEEEEGEIETKPTQLGYMWDDIYPDDDTGFFKDTPSGGEPWQEGGESNFVYDYEESWKNATLKQARLHLLLEADKTIDNNLIAELIEEDWEDLPYEWQQKIKSAGVIPMYESKANEGGFGSGRKGHSSWMRDMEYGGNYKVCPNCNVNTSFENNKCLLCGL